MSQLKPIPKFNIGHFPIGTVIDLQCPHLKFLNEDAEKEYVGQTYGLIRNATVVGHHHNSPDNWVVITDAPSPAKIFELETYSSSIDWVVAIKKRGVDSCAPLCLDSGCYEANLVTLCVLQATSEQRQHHHYDVDALQKAVSDLPGYSARKWGRKKKLKAIRRLLPRFKMSLKQAIKNDREFMAGWYDQDDSWSTDD